MGLTFPPFDLLWYEPWRSLYRREILRMLDFTERASPSEPAVTAGGTGPDHSESPSRSEPIYQAVEPTREP